MKASLAWVRQSARVIRMVSELHRMGYQHARIMPYEYPLAYRVHIGPRHDFSHLHGAIVEVETAGSHACYTAASGDHYFDWADATRDDARGLADKLVARFPDLAAACRGSDWAYAGWLSDLLGMMERHPGRLPVTQWEYMDEEPVALRAIPFRSYDDHLSDHVDGDMFFPLPPIAA